MPTETELQFKIRPVALAALMAHPLLQGAYSAFGFEDTYFDTPDLALAKRRLGLRLRKRGRHWLQTVKTAEPSSGGLAQRSEWETPVAPESFDFSAIDDDTIRAHLRKRRSELVPIFTTRLRRTLWLIEFGDSRIELALDRGTLISGDQKQSLCELELELKAGVLNDLFDLALQLQSVVHLHPMATNKAERGYVLRLRACMPPCRASSISLSNELGSVAVFREIVFACLAQLQRNEEGVCQMADPEYVHQARVALRRLRAAISFFAPVLPEDFVATYQAAWKALALKLGDARDWDVFIAETLPPLALSFPEHHVVRRLKVAAPQKARKAHQQAAQALSSPEYSRLLLEFTAASCRLPEVRETTLLKFAEHRLRTRAHRVEGYLDRYLSLSATERHALRIALKKLRYMLEFLAPLISKKKTRSQLAEIQVWQDYLGQMNDQVTGVHLATQIFGKLPELLDAWFAGRQMLLVATMDSTVSR